MATDKQIKYALSLLGKNGYSTKYMDKSFKELGASMKERSGSVEAWLKNMSTIECSALIDQLKDD